MTGPVLKTVKSWVDWRQQGQGKTQKRKRGGRKLKKHACMRGAARRGAARCPARLRRAVPRCAAPGRAAPHHAAVSHAAGTAAVGQTYWFLKHYRRRGNAFRAPKGSRAVPDQEGD